MLEWLEPEGDKEALELVNYVIETVGTNPKVRCLDSAIYLFGDTPLVAVTITNQEPEKANIGFKMGRYGYAYTTEGARAMMDKGDEIDIRQAPDYPGDKHFRVEMCRRILEALPDFDILSDEEICYLLKKS